MNSANKSSTPRDVRHAPAQGADQTISVPEDLAPPAARARAWCVVGLFLLAIYGTGTVDALWPRPRPALIGGEAQRDRARRANAKWLDGTRQSLLEEDMRLTSRVRSLVAPTYTLWLYAYLHEASHDAVVGRDGWLFHRGRAVPPWQFSDEVMANRAAATLAWLQRALAARNLRLIVAPIPRKEFVYRDSLPRGLDARPRIEHAFVAALREHRVEVVDLTKIFEEHAGERLYFREGTHWSQRAEILAAEEIARAADLIVPPAERLGAIVTHATKPADFDALSWLGIDARAAARHVADQRVEAFELVDQAGQPLDPRLDARAPHIVLSGTSFSANRTLDTWLAHFTNQPIAKCAELGSDGIEPLFRFLLDDPRAARVDTVIAEIPLHLVFDASPWESVSEFAARGARTITVSPVATPAMHVFDEHPLALSAKPQTCATLAEGSFARAGDGLFYVRLDGRLDGANARVEVVSGGVASSSTWRAGENSALVPVIDPHSTTEALSVVARTGGDEHATLVLDSVEIVAACDARAAVELPIETANGVQRITPSPTRALGTNDVLWLELATTSSPPSTLEVTALVGDAATPERSVWSFERVRPGASVLIDLGAFARRPLLAFEIACDQRIASARLASAER